MFTLGSFQRLIRIIGRIQDGFQFEFLLTYFHAFVSDDGLKSDGTSAMCFKKKKHIEDEREHHDQKLFRTDLEHCLSVT
jgi:hypothetical protein